jgi:hypothetical protein
MTKSTPSPRFPENDGKQPNCEEFKHIREYVSHLLFTTLEGGGGLEEESWSRPACCGKVKATPIVSVNLNVSY